MQARPRPVWPKAARARAMRAAGFVQRKATLNERAEKLVFFSGVMLRRKLSVNDAKCLLQNWEPYGPNALWWFPKTGGKHMPRITNAKAVRKAKKAAKRVAPKSKKAGRAR